MALQPPKKTRPKKVPTIYQEIGAYAKPDLRKAMWQVANSMIPYLALWALMVIMLRSGLPYWLVLIPLVIAAGFLARIFIIFHDCTHGSFTPSARMNRVMGYISGVMTFTPFEQWRRSHAVHHATVGDLDRRGTGDVWTLTVEEYLNAPWSTRLAYRVVRNPFVMFGIGPIIMFFLSNRLAQRADRKRERISVIITNLALLAIALISAKTIGIRAYLLIQLPVMYLAGVAGIWLFYVQHQYEEVYWAHHDAWDPLKAALDGSSYYKLPKILQWFSGNIGLHHIHHVQPRIPNYNLQPCQDAIPILQTVKPLTIRRSLSCINMDLVDVERRKLISFRALRSLPKTVEA
jgi:omega-6 fatty acid desaturase (delta-12 desaturase)